MKSTFDLKVGSVWHFATCIYGHAALWVRLRNAPSGCRLSLQQWSLFGLFETIIRFLELLLFLSKSADGRPFAFVTLALAVLYRCALAG